MNDKDKTRACLLAVLESAKCIKQEDCKYTAPPNYNDKEKYPDDVRPHTPYIKQ